MLLFMLAVICRAGDNPSIAQETRDDGVRADYGIVNVPTAAKTYLIREGVHVRETVDTYLVTGATCSALDSQLDGADGYAAFTAWSIYWTFRRRPAASVSIEYTFPYWVPDTEPAVELVKEWNRYVRRLRFHEHGHRTIALSAAARILVSGSHEAANDLMDRSEHEDDVYDRRTEHGRTQGAVLSCA